MTTAAGARRGRALALGCGVASAAFLGLAIARAVAVPLTYDEAAAWQRYAAGDALSVFSFAVATNHVLHSLLMRLSATFAGGGELALRLPSLAAYALYLYAAWRIVRRLRSAAVAAAGFLLLNLNLYLLDYFSLSRGYALSLGLLMAALYYTLRLARSPQSPHARRRLVAALALLCAAVLANFSLLNAYLAVVVILTPLLAVAHGGRDADEDEPAAVRRSRAGGVRAWAAVVAASLAFAVLALSQDVHLSERLYEPVIVSVTGLSADEASQMRVWRIDARGRRRELPRQGDVWQPARPEAFAGLRVELPPAAVGRQTFVEVRIGTHVFGSSRRAGDLWTVTENGRVLESRDELSLPRPDMESFREIVNWAGDGRYARALATRALLTLGLLAALAALLEGVARLGERTRLLPLRFGRPLAMSVVGLAGAAGVPLAMLRRDGELHYGGESGLVEDTFGSLVSGSFYGIRYLDAQNGLVLLIVAATVAAFAVLAAAAWRRRALAEIVPAGALFALLALVTAGMLAQRLLFGTPYLLGRTAIFFIPVYVLFLTFTAEAMLAAAPGWRRGVLAFLALAVAASVLHVARGYTVRSTIDWPDDAATKEMMRDLVAALNLRGTGEPGARITLGVEWIHFPVARYYAGRSGVPIDVTIVPAPETPQYVYARDRVRPPEMRVLHRYSRTQAALAVDESAR